jgi:hypothetical protein
MGPAAQPANLVPMTPERIMEMVRTLPPRTMPEERRDYLGAISNMVRRLASEAAADVQACDHALPLWAGDGPNNPNFWCKKCGAVNLGNGWIAPGSAGVKGM